MEDITGKKFSLQDWVMKRAANQSGVVLPQVSARQLLSEQDMAEEERPVDMPVEVEMKAVSNGSSIQASALNKDASKDVRDEPRLTENSASQGNPLQQLQIVRLLTDLGDRLRQSEKEREVLWKELEICRKQIADMSGREDKTEKSYVSLESQMNQREVFVKELVEKQIGLEQKFKDQLDNLEKSKAEQVKLQDKLNSVETAAGSAIVRVEDAIAENKQLSKRVEQLGQEKARLTRKLEVMEETLTQTQNILQAKALVLLTDQAVAARTNLPQTPAWTGDDTLKVAAAATDTSKKEAGPVADLAASLRPKKATFRMSASTAMLIGLVIFGVVGGVIISHFISLPTKPNMTADAPARVDENLEPPAAEDKVSDTAPAKANQEDLMAKAAQIANQIEPSSLSEGDEPAADAASPTTAPVADGVLPEDFQSAQAAQDKAVADFKAEAPTATLTDRISADKALPKAVADIEASALAGNANAQHDLAAIYTAGHAGVKVNYSKAAQWFEEAAHNGVSNAQYNLAVLYHQGLGVKKDTAKAMELYRVAASNNHPEAQYNLAIAYVEGVGTEYNPQIASVYFEQAASGGIVEAAYNLGLLHENGLLGESQPDEAVFWYTLAADKGNPDAAKALKQLKTQLSMTDEDAARVTQKVAEQKPAFLNAAGKPALPNQKQATQQQQVAPSAPVTTLPAKKSVSAAPVAVPATPAADPVIVSQIQEQLIRLGIYKGLPNGTMSPVVAQAIKTYQEKNGMKVDGKASDDLLVRMLAAGVDAQNTAAAE